MSTVKQPAAVAVYQLRVTLRDTSPLIWRRLLVASATTIAHLHAIVQTAMGWEDLHLHQFRIHGKAYGVYRDGGISFADDARTVTLSNFRLRKGERFIYEYDMGDFWQHDIWLEGILPLDPRKRYPLCTDGAGDCPPEDCGGPGGYRSLLDERSSWPELLHAHDDVLLVAERLRAFFDGGPRPTDEDTDFVDALERMHDRLEEAPTAFNRRTVNAVLRALA